jgi:hypothetical protein
LEQCRGNGHIYMAPASSNKIGVLDVSMHALAAYTVATVVEVSMSHALSWSQARDAVLTLGYLLPTCDELKVARVLGSVAHNPGYTNDMWMPVRRLDRVEGDWCEIGTNHGGPYVSHIETFGNIGESWSTTDIYNVWRPTTMMYAVRGQGVSEGLGALISPFYNKLFPANFSISTACAASQVSLPSCLKYVPNISEDAGGWILVRHLPPGDTWHPATDSLQGTHVYGTPSDDGSAWSITFGNFNEFLFSSGDKTSWLVTTKAAAIGEFYEDAPRDILKSSISTTPYQARWYNREIHPEDPWISLTDHATAVGSGQSLYGEDSYGAANVNHIAAQGGMTVFVR